MLLNLDEYKQQQFDDAATKMIAAPKKYLNFESVSDFYKAQWLDQFPVGTTVSATGLDDGAEEFCAVLQFKQQYLKFDVQFDRIILNYKNKQGEVQTLPVDI